MVGSSVTVREQAAGLPAAAPTSWQASFPMRSLGVIAQIWATWVRHKWVILAFAIIGVLLGVAATLMTTPVYRSNARLVFDPRDTPMLMDGKVRSRPSYLDPLFDFTAIGLLQSRELAERVVRSLNLSSSPYFANQKAAPAARLKQATDNVMGNVEIVQQRQTRLIDVYFRSRNPAMSAAVANGIADNFIQEVLERRLNENSYARRYLLQQLNDTRVKLEESEKKLVDFERATKMITIETRGDDGKAQSQSMNNAELGKVALQLTEATQRRIQAESQYRSQALNPGGVRDSALASSTQSELSQLRAHLAELRTTFGEAYPEVIATRDRIAALEKEVAGSAKRNVSADEVAYKAAVAEEQGLRDRFNDLQSKVLGERSGSTQFTVLSRDVDTNRELYDALLQRYKEVGVTGNVADNNISVADRAETPTGPIRPILSVNIMLGLIGGLAIGLFGVFAYDTVRDVVASPRDVEEDLRLKALGAIPLDVQYSNVSEALADPRSALTEAYFAVANILRFASPTGIPKSLLLTSTLAQEGKSSSSYGIARSVVPMGKRVLIVDADLRRPTFRVTHDRYEGPGLVHLLTGQATVEEVIKKGPHGIDFLLAGGTPPNPSELFSGGKVAEVIEALTQRYDLVIIDAPPILGYVDAPILSSFADATIIVFQSGRIRTSHAQVSVDKMRKAGANLIGGLITKYTKKNDEYGYGYGYDYYGDADLSDNESKRRHILVGAGPVSENA